MIVKTKDRLVKNIVTWRWEFGLIFVFCCFVIVNAIVLYWDNIYPEYDSAGFVFTAYELAGQVQRGEMPRLREPIMNPPLFEYVMMVVILLFGRSIDIITQTNLLFAILLFLGLYGIGKRLYGPAEGFLIVVVCVSMPGVFGMSRLLWHEFPLMCVLPFSYYLLFKTERFTRLSYVVWWAVSVGAALLIRSTTCVYIGIPVLIYVLISLYHEKNKSLVVRRVMLSVCIIFLTTWWWYHENGGFMRSQYNKFFNLHKQHYVTPVVECIRFAAVSICENDLYVPLYVLFIIAFPFLFIRSSFETKLIGIGILTPLLIHAFSKLTLGFGSNRFFIPMLPLMAIAIGNFYHNIKNKRPRKMVFISLIIISCVQVILVNTGHGRMLQMGDRNATVHNATNIIIEGGKKMPRENSIDLDELLETMQTLKKKETIDILMLMNDQQIENSFYFAGFHKSYLINIKQPCLPAYESRLEGGGYDDTTLLDEAEFVLSVNRRVEHNIDAWPFYATEWIPNIMNEFERRKDEYKKVRTMINNYDDEVILYQRIKRSNDED
ncbi:MAG: glycosyltransferase family 39 protein [Candidatus Omnitrophica bacterium]|nr:glycosyltransferase family 39 protein [Candidatus Omnitrophota bacterium]